ncbi:MAG TPA: hypothetical protein VE621_04025 [Bryobacteraceae bacterium]|jgi:hypothetical protein|nr:hypothetical protein [Bryobacteraceae bacterium]
MEPEDNNSAERVIESFRSLIREMRTGRLQRNTFQPWEIELLLDAQQITLPPSLKSRLLERYERVALKRMAKQKQRLPMKFSEYVATTWVARDNPDRATSTAVPREEEARDVL